MEKTKIETTPFPINQISQSMNIANTTTEGREGMPLPRTEDTASICAKKSIGTSYRELYGDLASTANGLEGLVDAEPPWNTGCNPTFIQDQEIQIQWTRIETSLAILRNLHIERANMEFWTRAKMLMEGIR